MKPTLSHTLPFSKVVSNMNSTKTTRHAGRQTDLTWLFPDVLVRSVGNKTKVASAGTQAASGKSCPTSETNPEKKSGSSGAGPSVPAKRNAWTTGSKATSKPQAWTSRARSGSSMRRRSSS